MSSQHYLQSHLGGHKSLGTLVNVPAMTIAYIACIVFVPGIRHSCSRFQGSGTRIHDLHLGVGISSWRVVFTFISSLWKSSAICHVLSGSGASLLEIFIRNIFSLRLHRDNLLLRYVFC